MTTNLIKGSKEWAIEKSKQGFSLAVKTTKWNADEPFNGWEVFGKTEGVEASKYTEGWYLYDANIGFFRPQYDISANKKEIRHGRTKTTKD